MELPENLYTELQNNKHFNSKYLLNYQKYLNMFKLVEYNLEVTERFNDLQMGKFYRVVGRINLNRKLGKISFIQIVNYGQSLQLILLKDKTLQYNILSLLSRGDVICVQGILGVSKTNTVSLIVHRWSLVSKTVMQHPDKVGGMRDNSVYKNKRFLNFVYDAKLDYNLRLRSSIITNIRNMLGQDGYLEVDTPILQYEYGGAAANPFITTLNETRKQVYMSVAPELKLKDLIFGGWNKIYSITHNFRNEGIDKTHHPEFSALQFYSQNKDYMYMAKYSMQLVINLAKKLKNSSQILYDGKTINLQKYSIKTYHEVLDRYYPDRTNINLKNILAQYVIGNESEEQLEYILFDKYVVPKLIDPVLVINFPLFSTPLAKQYRQNIKLVEQCQIYVAGFELANIYSETNSLYELVDRQHKHSINLAHVDMLAYGQYIHGGAGIGIERLVMLLANETSIKNVIFFPL